MRTHTRNLNQRHQVPTNRKADAPLRCPLMGHHQPAATAIAATTPASQNRQEIFRPRPCAPSAAALAASSARASLSSRCPAPAAPSNRFSPPTPAQGHTTRSFPCEEKGREEEGRRQAHATHLQRALLSHRVAQRLVPRLAACCVPASDRLGCPASCSLADGHKFINIASCSEQSRTRLAIAKTNT